MKKTLPLVAVIGVVLIVAALLLGEWQRRQQLDRNQAAHLVASCVNQGLLSLFRLQRNDWAVKPDFYRQEEISLQSVVAGLPEKILDSSPGWRGSEAALLCTSLTENSIRQHGTIYGPLGKLAQAGIPDLVLLADSRIRKRQQRMLRRMRISAQAASHYMEDLKADIKAKLEASVLDPRTQQAAWEEIQREVLDYYRQGDFSRAGVERYLARREKLMQLLAENPTGYSYRGGTLYFHSAGLRRRVDSLYRTLLQGHGDFLGNWQQVVRYQQQPVEIPE